MLFEQVTELMVAKAEAQGRLRAVAVRGSSRIGEQLSFERLHFVVEVSADGLESVIAEQADVLGRNLVGRVTIDRTLDDVLELAHVSGKVVPVEQIDRGLGQPLAGKRGDFLHELIEEELREDLDLPF